MPTLFLLDGLHFQVYTWKKKKEKKERNSVTQAQYVQTIQFYPVRHNWTLLKYILVNFLVFWQKRAVAAPVILSLLLSFSNADVLPNTFVSKERPKKESSRNDTDPVLNKGSTRDLISLLSHWVNINSYLTSD